jgi:uncharacterized protein
MPDFEGRFLWYELKTTDPEAAKAFYSDVVGWASQDAAIPNLRYTLFTAADTPIAGLTDLSDQAKEAGVMPNWLGYIACPIVAVMVDKIKQFGGYEHVPPTLIPGIGRFAVVTDPQRAEFGLLTRFGQPAYEPAAQDSEGQVGWHELLAADWPAAFEFYSALFGWRKVDAVDIGGMGTYQLFAAGEQTIGGMFNKPAPVARPFWLYYFNVGAIDAASQRVTAAGGRIVNGPMQVPGGRWIAQCTDPQGAMFALAGGPSAG